MLYICKKKYIFVSRFFLLIFNNHKEIFMKRNNKKFAYIPIKT